MKKNRNTPPISLRVLEHGYFKSIISEYLKRNDILKMEITYDKSISDEVEIFWVYAPDTDCENGKIKFFPLK